MNEELYTLFHELPPETRKALDFVFKDAPKMLALLKFLKEQPEPFRSPKAIHAIYEEDLNLTDFKVLTNRYHKLRQTLIEWLYHFLKKTGNFATREEQELDFLKFLVSKNQFYPALQRALMLEIRCWDNNLFELLPDLLHLIIFCQQSLAYHRSEMVAYETKLEQAVDLNHILQKLQNLYQMSYAITEEADYQNILNNIRKLTGNYKDSPRFHLIYHYTAFSRGNFVPMVVRNASHALTRHLNKIETIKKQFPEMPFVFISLPRAKAMYAKLLLLKSIFHFLKSKFSEAVQALKELEVLKKNNPTIEFPESEGALRNSISILVGGQQFDWAWSKSLELERFYEKNEYPEKEVALLYEQSHIFFFQFPKGDMNALKNHYQRLNDFISNKSTPNLLLISKVWLDLTLRKPVEEEGLKKIKAHYSITENYIDTTLIAALSESSCNKDRKGIQATIKLLNAQLKQKCDNVQELFLKQLIKIGKYYL